MIVTTHRGPRFQLSEQWQTFEQSFCGLVPEGWGGNHDPLNPAELVNLQFRISAWQEFELWLDDLAFVNNDSQAVQSQCARPCPLAMVPPTARIEPEFTTVQTNKYS